MAMTDNPKCILYTRVSTPGQAEHLRAYARTSGLEVLETIEDAGVSGGLRGCGEAVRGKKSRFRPGHDARLHGELKRNLEKDPLFRNERFIDEQKAYTKERELV